MCFLWIKVEALIYRRIQIPEAKESLDRKIFRFRDILHGRGRELDRPKHSGYHVPFMSPGSKPIFTPEPQFSFLI